VDRCRCGQGLPLGRGARRRGEVLLSRRVENDEADLSALVEEALSHGPEQLTWATDQPGGSAALLLAVLWERDQRVLYVPGIAVDRARDAHRGESKTDARDARLIAEQARLRRDLSALEPGEELLAELKLLVAHRRDLVLDQARAIVRLREALVSLFPGIERALDFRTTGPLVLVSRYQTPQAVRRAGRKRIEAYLRSRGVRNASRLAEAALRVAGGQRARMPAEGVAAGVVRDLAERALALKERTAELEGEIEERFSSHPLAEILVSLPGMGPSSGPSSWPRWATPGAPSRAPASSPPTPGSCRRPATPASGRATTAGCAAATRRSRSSSTGPPSPACATTG